MLFIVLSWYLRCVGMFWATRSQHLNSHKDAICVLVSFELIKQTDKQPQLCAASNCLWIIRFVCFIGFQKTRLSYSLFVNAFYLFNQSYFTITTENNSIQSLSLSQHLTVHDKKDSLATWSFSAPKVLFRYSRWFHVWLYNLFFLNFISMITVRVNILCQILAPI